MEIIEALSTIGLDEPEQSIYIALAKHEWATALQLSQISAIKRSTLYRVLERLMHKGLVEQRVDDKTTYFNLIDTKNLDVLIRAEEDRLSNMKAALKTITSKLPLLNHAESPTSVRFYRGTRALQGLEWQRFATSHTELLIFDSNQWDSQLGKDFAENIRAEILKQHITIRELHSHDQAKPIPPNAEADWTDNAEYIRHCYRHRRIDPAILPIDNDLYIQPTMITMQSFTNDEMVGISITSPAYVKLLRGLFELAWNQATPIDDFG